MEETAKMDGHLSSAAAFVEGGIQDACDDACSICLEEFVESDPSTVTSCKHEFHLQCILEWCQRSSQCPMCWQPISLKDPTSQELLEAVERERSLRVNRSRNSTIFHHPALGDFELQHLPVGANDAELEERIIQHLAAAAAMGRAHHIARREGQRGRSAAHGRTQFLVFSTHPNAPASGSVPVSSAESGGEESTPLSSASVTLVAAEESPGQAGHVIPGQADRLVTLPSGSTASAVNSPGVSNSRNLAAQSTPVSQDRAGPSDFHSFSESLKSRLNSVSMRYKESITKSTRGWKERFFSRNTSMADLGSEVRREVNAGIATVSRMMERLDTRDNSREAGASTQQIIENHPVPQLSNERVTENHSITLPNDNSTSTPCAPSSALN